MSDSTQKKLQLQIHCLNTIVLPIFGFKSITDYDHVIICNKLHDDIPKNLTSAIQYIAKSFTIKQFNLHKTNGVVQTKNQAFNFLKKCLICTEVPHIIWTEQHEKKTIKYMRLNAINSVLYKYIEKMADFPNIPSKQENIQDSDKTKNIKEVYTVTAQQLHSKIKKHEEQHSVLRMSKNLIYGDFVGIGINTDTVIFGCVKDLRFFFTDENNNMYDSKMNVQIKIKKNMLTFNEYTPNTDIIKTPYVIPFSWFSDMGSHIYFELTTDFISNIEKYSLHVCYTTVNDFKKYKKDFEDEKLIFEIESIKLSNMKYNWLTSLTTEVEPSDESLTIVNEKNEILSLSNANIPKTTGVLRSLGNLKVLCVDANPLMKVFEHAVSMIVQADRFVKNITLGNMSHRFESVAMTKCVDDVKINKYSINNDMCVIRLFDIWNMHLFDSYADFYIEFDTPIPASDVSFQLKNSKNIETHIAKISEMKYKIKNINLHNQLNRSGTAVHDPIELFVNVNQKYINNLHTIKLHYTGIIYDNKPRQIVSSFHEPFITDALFESFMPEYTTCTNTGSVAINGGIGTRSETSTSTGSLTVNGGVGVINMPTGSITNGVSIPRQIYDNFCGCSSTTTGSITIDGGIGISPKIVNKTKK
jgi:hypothetical protein